MGRWREAVRRRMGGLAPAHQRNTVLFLIGFFCGIVFLNIGKGMLLGERGLFDPETLTGLKYTVLDEDSVFCYVLKKRGVLLFLVLVLSTTYLGRFVCRAIVTWFGFAFGLMLAALTARFGLKGQALAVVWLFPHFLVYFPAMSMFLLWCEKIHETIYHQKKLPAEEKRFFLWKTFQFLLFAVALCFGCMLEAYVGSRLLIGYLKVF